MKNETFTPERIKAEADTFFEWDGEDRSLVTTTSCLLFAQHIAGLMQARAAQPEPVQERGWPDRDYWCKCADCGERFTGHKRQVICRVCTEERITQPEPAAQGEFGEAYQGAREDLAIWKRRALEAEEKLRAQCDDQSFMGEPLVQPYEAPREKIEALFKQLGFSGQVSVGEILDAALSALKAQQVGQEPVAWQQRYIDEEEGPSLWQHADENTVSILRGRTDYEIRALYTTPQPAPAQDVAGWIPVTERLPEVETDVLVRGVRRNEVMHRVAGLFNGEWSSQETEDLLLGDVTHWMPLPAAPATHDKQIGGAE